MPVNLARFLTFEVVDSWSHFIYKECYTDRNNFEIRLPTHLLVGILMSICTPEFPLIQELLQYQTLYNETDPKRFYKAYRFDCEFRCRGKRWSRKIFTAGGKISSKNFNLNPRYGKGN